MGGRGLARADTLPECRFDEIRDEGLDELSAAIADDKADGEKQCYDDDTLNDPDPMLFHRFDTSPTKLGTIRAYFSVQCKQKPLQRAAVQRNEIIDGVCIISSDAGLERYGHHQCE